MNDVADYPLTAHRQNPAATAKDEAKKPEPPREVEPALPAEGQPFDPPTNTGGDPGGGADPDFPVPGRGPKGA